jgi:uncharacterized protein (DUF488 family)
MNIRHGKSGREEDTRVLTIGHSTLTIENFIQILHAHGVTCVVDVRSIPRSRHNPQFNRDILPGSLKVAGIDYEYIEGLGGLRQPISNSPNTGWENASFRGYADYMQTKEFEENMDALIDLAKSKQIVLMCAESVPWRCHRSMIADALLVRGISTEHITSINKRSVHALTPFANIHSMHITYPNKQIGATGKKEVTNVPRR